MEGFCSQEQHDLQTQKQIEACFSLCSPYLSSNVQFQVFRFLLSSISAHTLCWFCLIHKGCTFQSLEITPSSYCHHVLPLEQEQFGLGEAFCSLMFPQQKQFCHLLVYASTTATLLSKCTHTAADMGQLACFSLGSFVSKQGYCPVQLLPTSSLSAFSRSNCSCQDYISVW